MNKPLGMNVEIIYDAETPSFPYVWTVWAEGTEQPKWHRAKDLDTAHSGLASTKWGAKRAAKRWAKRIRRDMYHATYTL